MALLAWGITLMLLVGCAPSAEPTPAAQPLPTRIPTTTPVFNNLDNAEAVASTFLQLWQLRDYAGMYALLSAPSQQATSYAQFEQTYTRAESTMSLTGMQFQQVALARDSSRIVTLMYNASFETRLVGSFDDNERQMQLVLDPAMEQWRVAWSPGLIFREMGSGGLLRLETFQPRRANIYDREGNILADMNGRIVVLKVIQDEMPDRALCVGLLAEVLNQPVEDVEARLAANAPDWLADVGLIEPETYLSYREPLERDCNAQFDNRATRRYIYGELFAHIIGSVGYPDPAELDTLAQTGLRQDSIIGRSGVEATWDETLRGTPGGRLSIVSPTGETLRILAERGTQPAQSVYLTIDTDLQRMVLNRIAREYANNIEGWGSTSRGAAAVVVNVNTGEILAMVSYPTYNANAFTPFPVMGRETGQAIVRQVQEDPRRPLLNRVTQGRYPSGSTMKTFTAIAALDSGLYDFDDRYNSVGTWNRDILRVDWRRGGHGLLNLAQALTHSCNSCFYEVGYQMDNVDQYLLPDYMNQMGFGVDTGMTDLPASAGFIGTPETKSQFHPEAWTFSDAVDMAIGQGMVEVTPLQMAMAYAMVANDGLHYRPQLISHVGLLDEVTYQMEPEVIETIELDDSVLDFLVDGLCDVTTESYGTASHIFRVAPRLMDEIGVCGKTGTAQNPPNPQPHAWFAGWAPAESPEIVVIVMVENAGDGSAVTAPITRDIMEYYFFGEDIAP
ncbi:MAG: penicillin-binding transpeptidase domain-containing protein [Chloroflexota bacterium]